MTTSHIFGGPAAYGSEDVTAPMLGHVGWTLAPKGASLRGKRKAYRWRVLAAGTPIGNLDLVQQGVAERLAVGLPSLVGADDLGRGVEGRDPAGEVPGVVHRLQMHLFFMEG